MSGKRPPQTTEGHIQRRHRCLNVLRFLTWHHGCVQVDIKAIWTRSNAAIITTPPTYVLVRSGQSRRRLYRHFDTFTDRYTVGGIARVWKDGLFPGLVYHGAVVPDHDVESHYSGERTLYKGQTLHLICWGLLTRLMHPSSSQQRASAGEDC